MNNLKRLLLCFFFIFTLHITLYTLHSYAAVPHLINYQGRLTDSSGTPLNGSYAITFRIYDAEAAGNLLWEETHSGALIQKGIFGVLLGSVSALNLPFDKPYFLEIKVGNEVMSPRQSITSAGYAIRTEEAEKFGGKPSSDYALATDITTMPTANKAVKLDSNAKLPLSALKVYDSGWFAITTSTTYTKIHNLGTTKVIAKLYFASDANGSNAFESSGYVTSQLQLLTSTTITLQTIGLGVISQKLDTSGNYQNITNGYARIIMLALE